MHRPPAPPAPSGRRALMLNSGWLLGEKVIRLVVGQAFVTVLLARYLGPAEFGVLNFAIAVVALFGAVAGLGLDEILVRELVRRPTAEHPALMASALRLKLIGATLAVLLALGTAILMRPAQPRVWSVAAMLAIGLWFTPCDVFDAWFQANARFAPAVAARLQAFLISAVARVALVVGGYPLWLVAAATALEPAAAALGLALAARRAGAARATGGVDRVLARTLLREGAPLLFSGLFVLATMHLDKVLVAQLAGDEAAGFYAAATRLTELFYAVPVAIGAAAVPALLRRRETDRASYASAVLRLGLLLLAAGFAISLVISWRAHDIVRLLFGAHFAPAAPPVAVHVWSLGFVFLVSLRGRLLVLEGLAQWMPVLAAATAGLNMALNVWLIPRFGVVGAAWSATTAWGFSALLAPVLLSPIRQRMREFWAAPAKP